MLGFELTRRCNMRCPHCLRGPAQNQELPDLVIQAALDEILPGRGIDRLLLTGGEPSLAPDRIKAITTALRERGIAVGTVVIVSNGKGWTEEFALAVSEIADYSSDGVDLSVSDDRYHEEVAVRELSFSPNVTIGKKEALPKVLRMGNAKDLPEAEETSGMREERGDVVWGCDGIKRGTCDYEFTDCTCTANRYKGVITITPEVQEHLRQVYTLAGKKDLSGESRSIRERHENVAFTSSTLLVRDVNYTVKCAGSRRYVAFRCSPFGFLQYQEN